MTAANRRSSPRRPRTSAPSTASSIACVSAASATSGLGSVVDEYRATFRGAKLGEALAIRGEDAERSRLQVDKWLRHIGLVQA